MYKKVDDYLTPAQYKLLKAQVFSGKTPWTFLRNVTNNAMKDSFKSPTNPEHWTPGMGSSIFYEGKVENNSLWTLVQPLIDYSIGRVMRVKLGFVYGRVNKDRPIINNAHVDWNIPHVTQLYYLTDSIAPTYLYFEKQDPNKDGYISPSHDDLTVMEVSEHKANSCIFFDGLHYHASSSPEPFDVRVNININYEQKQNKNKAGL